MNAKCPHCGRIVNPGRSTRYLVPRHNDDGVRCPGSGENPRGLGDRRPTWKDGDDDQRWPDWTVQGQARIERERGQS